MDEPSAERDIERGLAAAAPRMGAGATTVEGLKRLTAGATQEVWRFELVTGETRTPLILRRAPGGVRVSETAIGLEAEARLLEAA